jgi:hypothetical protein
MTWQDIVPIIGNIIFAGALIPSIVSRQKPHRWSCFLTGSVLWVYVFTLWDMTLWYWSLATMATALPWTILLLQRRPHDKNR